jgi:hypothetical protein
MNRYAAIKLLSFLFDVGAFGECLFVFLLAQKKNQKKGSLP